MVASTSLAPYRSSISVNPSSPNPSAADTSPWCPVLSPLSPSILAIPSCTQSPRVSYFMGHNQLPPPSPLLAHSSPTATRSKRARIVTINRRVVPPKR